jgi:hypothetical protein
MSDAFKASTRQGGAHWPSSVVPALLDFERTPGRYRLALREPGVLFEQTHAVLQLAAGRAVKGMAPLAPGGEADAAQKAARYFVRAVLLRPGADHYALLGLVPGFEPPALRDHYRLMIRLTHPDFATSDKEWPVDAASRINLANDVLGSSVKRGQYDATLQAAKVVTAARPTAFNAPPPRSPPAAGAAEQGARQDLTQGALAQRERHGPDTFLSHKSKVILAAGGAVACVFALLLLTPPGNDGSLVAQPVPTTAPPIDSPSQALPMAEEANALASAAPALNSGKPTQVDLVGPVAATLPKTPGAVASPFAEAATTGAKLAPNLGNEAPAAAEMPIALAPDAARPRMAPDQVNQVPGRADQALANKLAQSLAQSPPVEIASMAGQATTTTTTLPDTQAASLALAPLLSLSPKTAAAPSTDPLQSPTAALAMADVQPLMAQVVGALESGVGENALDALDPASNIYAVRLAYLQGYYQFLQGERIAGLNAATFRASKGTGSFVVHGVLNLKLVGGFERATNRDLHIQATFKQVRGKPALTRLEVASAKP